jgi:PAS domain-containing protein
MFPDDDDFEFIGPDRDWNQEPSRADVFKAFRSPVYTTDADGWLTYYNDAAADLWGYRPELGKTRWCGCWRIFTMDGKILPLDQSPTAATLRRGEPVRGVQALLERPDGTRIPFMGFPTPLRDASGTLVAVSNVVVRMTRLTWPEAAEHSAEAWAEETPKLRKAALEPEELTGMLQATLAAIADVEFGFQCDRERLDGWSGPSEERDRILSQLEQKRQRQRHVLTQRAEQLQRQARAFIGSPPAEAMPRSARTASGRGPHH